MKSKLFIVALLVALLSAPGSALLVQRASAQNSQPSESPTSIQALADSSIPASAIIELEGESVITRELQNEPVSHRGRVVALDSSSARIYESQLEAQQENFKSRAVLVAQNLRVRTQLTKLANAISVEAPGREIAQLAALPGVRSVRLTKEYKATLDASVKLINAPAMWDRLGGVGVAGGGMRIAILDTGIDISNPLFSDAGYTAPDGFPRGAVGFTNNKVIVAKAFLNGNATPADENGHGTHVAGIAAGGIETPSPIGSLSGVAPQAYLGNYRVLNRQGRGADDLIARALEEVVSDGFHVANLSLGAESDGELSFLDEAVEQAVAAGVTVVVAAGNAGENGQMTISSPGEAPSAITVGAVSNSHIVGPVVSVTAPTPVLAAVEKIGSVSGAGTEAPLSATIGPMPYVFVPGRGCGAIAGNSLTGKVALIERGDCTFAEKVTRAKTAGAQAVIIFNQDISENTNGGENLVNMDVTGTTIPSVFVTRSHGLALRDWISSHSGAQISIAPFGSGSATADIMAVFSSRGPSSLKTLKPDLVAPGQIIYSGAIKQENDDGVSDPSGFAAVSGTSQAAPHIAGAAALLKQLHPSWTPEQIKSALISSAAHEVFNDVQKAGRSSLLDAGAGRADLSSASTVNATFSPASLSFGINKLKKKNLSLSATLKVTSEVDGANNFTLAVQQLDPADGITVSLSTTTLTLTGGQTGTVDLTIAALKSAPKRDFTGFIVVNTPTGQTLRVPYWVRFTKKK